MISDIVDWINRLNGYKTYRWIATAFLYALFFFRVFYFQGWYIVTYGLGIYIINLFIAFISPKFRPEEYESDEEEEEMTQTLPNTSIGRDFNAGGLFGQPKRPDADDVKPFIRRLPEFKFWYSITKGVLISLLLTTTRALDIPVYWPILLGYWILLLAITLRKQIQHMIKYKYLPFTTGKKNYMGGQASSISSLFSGFTSKPAASSTPQARPQFGSGYQSAFTAYQPTTVQTASSILPQPTASFIAPKLNSGVEN